MEKAKGGGDRKSQNYHPSQDATGDPSGNKTLAEKAKGNRGNIASVTGGSDARLPEHQPKTLSEMGVSKDQSSKWQLLLETEKAKGTDYGGKPALDGSRARRSNPPKTLPVVRLYQ
jgi:hypothetical protein